MGRTVSTSINFYNNDVNPNVTHNSTFTIFGNVKNLVMNK
jgi:hypothetical protein